MKFLIVIPSRYGSTRFEGKPLLDIAGKTLVQRTYLQALKTGLDARVVVATDDQRIYDHVKNFGEVLMTSDTHISGTDRCFEVADLLDEKYDVVINLQGDEPFIQPSQIELLASAFDQKEVDIATLKKPIFDKEELFNTNVVKVINDKNGKAIYFSRQVIPFQRNKEESDWVKEYRYYRHVGIYAFRTSCIQELKTLKESGLEKSESLEQLRWLENGVNIRILETDFHSPAIDSPADIQTVDNFLKMNPKMI